MKQIYFAGDINTIPFQVIEKAKSEGYEIVNAPEGIEIPDNPFDSTTKFPIINPLAKLPYVGYGQTTKGDLKRCKKGIHNYEEVIPKGEFAMAVISKVCIHCKKVIE